jgi:hypothetical protein
MSSTEAPLTRTIDPGTVSGNARTDGPDGSTCIVCPHPLAGHDALGRRFCTATHDVGWSRGCICR